MAERKPKDGGDKAKLVRKSLMVDEAKLGLARKALGASSDAEALRLALDDLLRISPTPGRARKNDSRGDWPLRSRCRNRPHGEVA